MALSPIAFVAPNYRDYPDHWIKAYTPGTTTPKKMYLDATGTPQVEVAKLQLNKDGFIVSAGSALVTPYIDEAYDLWLFPTAEEADNNDTSEALRIADNTVGAFTISDTSQDYIFDTVDQYKASTITFPIGKRIYLKDRQAHFEVISGTGTGNNLDIIASDEVNQSVEYENKDATINVKHIGALGAGASSDDSSALVRALEIGSVVYFPAVEAGNYYNMLTADLVLADVANPRNNLKIYGDVSADGDITSAIKFGSNYGLKVNGATNNYVLQNLTTENLFIGPINSVSRTTPIFKATGVLYWDRKNCFFQGDTLKQQNVIEMLWSLGLASRKTRVQGGLLGQSLGTESDPFNSIKLDSDNYNGSRVAMVTTCTSFDMDGGLVQSCGDGLQISTGVAESSSSVTISGTVYFENNKFWGGDKFTGRDVTVGINGFVRALNIKGNYHAQLAGDNAFTSGQGMSDIPPVKISKVQGFDISTNFWSNNGLSEYVELEYFDSGGIAFPRQGDIRNNTDLFTNMTPSTTWATGTTENEKFFVFEKDSVTIKDESELNIGVVKTVQSPIINVTGTGLVSVPIMESKHYGKITAMRLLCSDSFDTISTLNIGILASATYYASGFAVDAKSAFTTTEITQNNKRITSTGGPIIATLDVTGFTTEGSFSVEIDYIDVLE